MKKSTPAINTDINYAQPNTSESQAEHLKKLIANKPNHFSSIYCLPSANWSDTCYHVVPCRVSTRHQCHISGIEYQLTVDCTTDSLPVTRDINGAVSLFRILKFSPEINELIDKKKMEDAMLKIRQYLESKKKAIHDLIKSLEYTSTENDTTRLLLGEINCSISFQTGTELDNQSGKTVPFCALFVRSYDIKTSSEITTTMNTSVGFKVSSFMDTQEYKESVKHSIVNRRAIALCIMNTLGWKSEGLEDMCNYHGGIVTTIAEDAEFPYNGLCITDKWISFYDHCFQFSTHNNFALFGRGRTAGYTLYNLSGRSTMGLKSLAYPMGVKKLCHFKDSKIKIIETELHNKESVPGNPMITLGKTDVNFKIVSEKYFNHEEESALFQKIYLNNTPFIRIDLSGDITIVTQRFAWPDDIREILLFEAGKDKMTLPIDHEYVTGHLMHDFAREFKSGSKPKFNEWFGYNWTRGEITVKTAALKAHYLEKQ